MRDTQSNSAKKGPNEARTLLTSGAKKCVSTGSAPFAATLSASHTDRRPLKFH